MLSPGASINASTISVARTSSIDPSTIVHIPPCKVWVRWKLHIDGDVTI
jgi:hypothetical protein